MTTTDRQVRYVPLDDVQPDPRNPKEHRLDLIQASIDRFGFIDPAVIDDRSGLVVSGHGRVEALRAIRAAGASPPDGVRVDEAGGWLIPTTGGWASKSDAESAAALIALNRSTEAGGWADDALLDLLTDLSEDEGGLDGVGFSLEQIADLEEGGGGGDKPDPWGDRAIRPVPDAGEVEAGQVWKVGPHLLACGDSTDPGLWESLLDGRRADLLHTDPPYGIEYEGGPGSGREGLAGDGGDEYLPLLEAVIDTVLPHLREGAVSYVWAAPGPELPPFMQLLADRGLYRWMLVWVKDQATFGRADYHHQHEVLIYGDKIHDTLVYGWKPGAGHHPVEDRKQTTVWECPRPKDSPRHPTAKPIDLVTRAIRNSTDPGDLVVDPFAGSFSTVEAAQFEGRVGVGVELEPGYVRAALDHMAMVMGEEPVLLDTGDG